MDDIYNNIAENNLNKKRKTLVVFDDIIVDMISNKKLRGTYRRPSGDSQWTN